MLGVAAGASGWEPLHHKEGGAGREAEARDHMDSQSPPCDSGRCRAGGHSVPWPGGSRAARACRYQCTWRKPVQVPNAGWPGNWEGLSGGRGATRYSGWAVAGSTRALRVWCCGRCQCSSSHAGWLVHQEVPQRRAWRPSIPSSQLSQPRCSPDGIRLMLAGPWAPANQFRLAPGHLPT